MKPTERIIITALSLAAVLTLLLSMTQCVKTYNTEQNAIQLAHELR